MLHPFLEPLSSQPWQQRGIKVVEVLPWGFKPCPFSVNPTLPRQGTEVRVRAGPFTWELSPGFVAVAEPGPTTLPTGNSLAQAFQARRSQSRPPCGDHSSCPFSNIPSKHSILQGGMVLKLPCLNVGPMWPKLGGL